MHHGHAQALHHRPVEGLGCRLGQGLPPLRRGEHRNLAEGPGQARRASDGNPRDQDGLHRCREWLLRGLRAVHQGRAQALAQHHHHGRQRRHEGDDGGAHLQRRRHHQGRHRPGLRLHHPQADRRRLPAAVGRPGVRGCGARPRRPHRVRRRVHLPRGRVQGLRRRRGLRDARRHARRPRRVRRRGRPGGRRLLQGLLRNVQRHRHEEARGRRRGVPLLRGQDGEGAVPRPDRRDRPRHPGRHALRLHLRGRRPPQGDVQEGHLRPGDSAAEPYLRGGPQGAAEFRASVQEGQDRGWHGLGHMGGE
mmetsp:Transcript_24621/g.73206  ORF Transcript_24621/g.73206 Transcript_24621/m.73206 type:complete len:306 (+) Transcript_24621:303-1220(+)